MAKEESNKKGINWLVLIPVILIFVVGGSIGGAYVAAKLFNSPTSEAAAKHSVTISKKQKIVAVKKFLINLSPDNANEQQYVQLSLSVLVANEDDSSKLTKNIALVRDSVINVVHQKKASDILGAADSIPKLKNDLKDAINRAYGEKIVQQVFITDLVIQ
ncbi:flagellar basal body-associated FliL family protein [Liquorilactobacillus oeni]|uniref:Flagellar protein FliL n=2 Tax=Liquorilactobacillus oeni TaxID=303241 RepID=A0A0R1MC84_9LACO|nr:flagellar basal body-associated FliL family protein [Liquorilactobacillus oeni]AJA34199.1 flagellar biosynthesis protein FliL [Liquorilactobacillus oeni]KRL05505.1 hypothetical protein FD46_GL000922 [Liquorilactobacillus oeni DSM 19972]